MPASRLAGKSIWYVVVGIGYLLAFTLLSLTLGQA